MTIGCKFSDEAKDSFFDNIVSTTRTTAKKKGNKST